MCHHSPAAGLLHPADARRDSEARAGRKFTSGALIRIIGVCRVIADLAASVYTVAGDGVMVMEFMVSFLFWLSC